VLNPPPSTISIEINWRDNPWFPAVLHEEMETLKAADEDDYLHVWEGKTKQTLDGAIFADELRRAAKDGRLMRVPIDEAKPVETIWDLGRGDKTAIWFAQITGYEYRLVDYYEFRGKALPHYLKVLQDRGYLYGTAWLPHDAENELLIAEHNIEHQVRAAGYTTRIVPKTSVVARINAARTIFNRCVFDEEKCADGLNALRRWRFKVDPDTRQYSKDPQHDEYSHGGDAFTYMAVAMTEAKKLGGPKYSNKGIV
jgi:phage terminase large subunit